MFCYTRYLHYVTQLLLINFRKIYKSDIEHRIDYDDNGLLLVGCSLLFAYFNFLLPVCFVSAAAHLLSSKGKRWRPLL